MPRSTPYTAICDQSLRHLTGFDHRTFHMLLHMFNPLYEPFEAYGKEGIISRRRVPTTGRRRSRKLSACLTDTNSGVAQVAWK